MQMRGLTIWRVFAIGFSVILSADASRAVAAASYSCRPLIDGDRECEWSDRGLVDEPEAGSEDRRPGRRSGRPGPAHREGRRGWWRPEDGPRADASDPEMVGRVMEILRTKLPEFHERLEAFRLEKPERFERAIRKVMPVVGEYIRLRDRKPELAETIIEEFRIEERLRALSRGYRQAEDQPEAQAEVVANIERLVREQIELRFRRQMFRLEEFERRLRRQEERLGRHRARLEEEMERREELVAERVDEVKQGKVGEKARRFGPGHDGPDEGFRGRGHRGLRGDKRMAPRLRHEPRPGPDEMDDTPPPHELEED